MKKWIVTLLLVGSALQAAEEEEEPSGIAGKTLGYETRNATVLSMLGWGITIAVAIATFAALVENHPAPSSTTP